MSLYWFSAPKSHFRGARTPSAPPASTPLHLYDVHVSMQMTICSLINKSENNFCTNILSSKMYLYVHNYFDITGTSVRHFVRWKMKICCQVVNNIFLECMLVLKQIPISLMISNLHLTDESPYSLLASSINNLNRLTASSSNNRFSLVGR